jgi:type II secretory pathway component GspD/PulD (secretin)
VLAGIGAGYRVPVVVEPEVQGLVSLELHAGSLRTVFAAICQPKGWSFEVAPEGYLLVRRFVTRIYPVDYLQLTQSGSSSASVNLSQGVASGSAVGAGYNGNGGGTGLVGAGGAGGTNASGLGSSGGGAGSSSLSVSQQNDADFWGRLEADLKRMAGEGETLVVNRFAGLVQLRGSLQTHAVVAAYLRRVLDRVGRQARISVKVVEVDLNDQAKTGIDWIAATAAIGRLAGSSLKLGAATTTGPIAQVGATALASDSFTGTIGIGGVQAAISALAEQGRVRVESKPEIAALNNQTAFIQISRDQPFFSRTNTTTINAGGVAQAGAQPIVATNYAESTVSFGNVLELTVQIADDLTTKLSVSPAMTELQGTVTSPDGQETAPVTGTKRARTTVAVRNHETAVIGGFITETKATDERSIPGLSQVPLLGRAFATSVRVNTRTELVFFVTVNAEPPPLGASWAGASTAGAPASPSGLTPAPTSAARRIERVRVEGF